MKHRCPYCKRKMELDSPADLPTFPFCNERCRLADLNSWLTGKYVISRPMGEEDVDVEAPQGDAESQEERSADESDEEAD